jgi:hypothetical protein
MFDARTARARLSAKENRKRTGAGISPCLPLVSYCFHPEQNNLQINWIGMSRGAIIILKGEGKQT